jgi:SAM-dependent methyltransferase
VPLLLQAANPRPGERVLDLACGTGIVARRVAARVGAGGQVVGLDLNPAMLAVARSEAQREGVSVEWHEGRLEALPFPEGHFDLVLCQQGLQFVPEKRQALAEMHRVLRDGGRLALSVWRDLEHHPFFATLNDAVVRHLGIPALASPFALGDADELRELLTGAGFREVVIEPRSMTARFPHPEGFIAMEVDVIAAAVPSVQHLDAQARERLTEAIAGEMAGPIRELTQDGHLVIPVHAHVARACRRPT